MGAALRLSDLRQGRKRGRVSLAREREPKQRAFGGALVFERGEEGDENEEK